MQTIALPATPSTGTPRAALRVTGPDRTEVILKPLIMQDQNQRHVLQRPSRKSSSVFMVECFVKDDVKVYREARGGQTA